MFKTEAVESTVAVLGALIAVTGIAVGFIFSDELKGFCQSFFEQNTYTRYDYCYLLFLTMVAFVSVSVLFLAIVLGPGFGIEGIQNKATETVIYLIALVAVATIFYNNRKGSMTKDGIVFRAAPGNPTMGPNPVRTRLEYLILCWNVARFPVALIAGLVVTALSLAHRMPALESALQALPILLTTMAGFVLNDIYDLEKDRYSQRPKALAIGIVRLGTAQTFALLLIISTLAIAATIARGYSYYVVVGSLIGVIFYSVASRQAPLMKGLVTAALCCSPFIYANEIIAFHLPKYFYPFLLTFIFGREPYSTCEIERPTYILAFAPSLHF